MLARITIILITVLYSNISLANNYWEQIYSMSNFSKNIVKDIRESIFKNSKLYTNNNMQKKVMNDLNEFYNNLAKYQMGYAKAQRECWEKHQLGSDHNWANDIESCVHRKESKLLKKYFVHPDVVREAQTRFTLLFQNATEFATSTLLMKGYITKEEALNGMQRWQNNRNEIISEYYEIQVYAQIRGWNLEHLKLSAENNIEEKNEPPTSSSGSGFFVTTNGHIVTNFHVIEDCKNIYLNNEALKILAKDPLNDLAILKSSNRSMNFLMLEGDSPKKGEEVLVLGYPFGKNFGDESKLTEGIISALQGMGNDYSRFQMDAPIQPGNSGGPVINKKGNVVGVAVASANIQAFLKQFGTIPQNMNFAIKSNVLQMMLNANNINVNFSNRKTNKTNPEIVNFADPAVVYLECIY